jgi:branched-chain amino acid aminotransferase
MSSRRTADYLWLDGEVVPWAEATEHVTTVFGSASSTVFEGIRAYWSTGREQLYVFRLAEHMGRLGNSMKLVWKESEFSADELATAALRLLKANGVRGDFYIRVVAYDSGSGFFAKGFEAETRIYIETVPFASHLGAYDSMACCVSSWTRLADNVMPPRVKCGSNYANNRRALKEAQTNGYENAIMLNSQGKVTETTVSCLFMVRDGTPITSPVTSGILESITRASLMELFRERLGRPVIERDIDRTELYIADELFCCGTGQEITAITSVDRFPVGDGEVGPLTKEIETLYNSIVRGELADYTEWRSPVW